MLQVMLKNNFRSAIVGYGVLAATLGGATMPANAQEGASARAERFNGHGFAQITAGDRTFYIDRAGKRLFDRYIQDIGSADTAAQPLGVVTKDGRYGVLARSGGWVLPPEYQQIDTRFGAFWKVMKDGKHSLYSREEGMLLPFFDDVGYLDGRYFDVKAGTKWGVYDREAAQLAIPAKYDGFDYCGGCGRKSDYVYAQRDEKWGIMGFDGQVRVPFAYEHEHWGMRSDEWVRSFSKNGRPVVVHIPTGREFSADGRDPLEILAGGELVVQVNGRYGLIDHDANEILPAEYERITVPNANDFRGYHGPYAIVEKGGRKGVYQRGKGVLIPPQWDDVNVYDDYFALAKDGRWGLYDTTGRELLAPSYTAVTHVNDYFYSSGSKGITIFKTRQKALYGLYFAETGQVVSPKFHEIDLASLTYDGPDAVVVGEHQGEQAVYDFTGRELLPLGYASWSLWDTSSLRYFVVTKAGKQGLYDAELQREIIPPAFDQLRKLPGSGPIVLTVNGDYGDYRYGIRRMDGQEAVPAEYTVYDSVGGTFALLSGARNGGPAILIDGRRGVVTKLPARYAQSVRYPGLVLISDDSVRAQLYSPVLGKSVPNSKFAFAYAYDDRTEDALLERFSPFGLGWVRVDGRYGLLDTAGNWVTEPVYDRVLDFNAHGIAVGARYFPASDWRSQVGYVAYQFLGRDGRPLSSEVYTAPNEFLMAMDYFTGRHLVIRRVEENTGELRAGIADSTGQVLVPPKYDGVEVFNNGAYFLLSVGYKFGIADRSGQIILPVEFDNLLLNRYEKGTEITFPMLCYKNGEWQYYTDKGEVLQVEGVPSGTFTVNTGLW
ncbi:WG containing repeat-containing protein [Parapedobacter composti]|uniref:WG containing repeat-containing protein n=2 Tax=Parapedobacter composti TaxID=623281 RepID=A0A1I1F3X2_9SPHI|nr:WG containing repeat-containing protein [Parapedobacter composti]